MPTSAGLTLLTAASTAARNRSGASDASALTPANTARIAPASPGCEQRAGKEIIFISGCFGSSAGIQRSDKQSRNAKHETRNSITHLRPLLELALLVKFQAQVLPVRW